MNGDKKKCSSGEHKEIDAIVYCQKCGIYMRNKCESIHSKLCPNHLPYNLKENINEIFTGICLEKNHLNELDYFCKNHNMLCCAACISKIKGKGNGQHADCDICFIENIKDEKKDKLKNNIKILEDLTNSLGKSIDDLKKILEKNEKTKEELKSNIQKIFTKLRSALNDREDELLLKVDNEFDKLFTYRDLTKEGENLPKKVNYCLEKGKLINKEWEDDKLKIMINDCINIEKNIDRINKINKEIIDYNSKNIIFKFIPNEEENINEFINSIKSYGKLINYENWIISDILNTFDKKQKLKMWINPNNSQINTNLLYKFSRDGESIAKFHELCDNIKNNLVIIENENNEIFGSFCTWIWDTSGSDLTINDGFLFNLTNDKKYDNKSLRIHKGCKDHGPYIYSKFYFEYSMKTCIIQSGEFPKNNKIKQIEIYQILDGK